MPIKTVLFLKFDKQQTIKRGTKQLKYMERNRGCVGVVQMMNALA